MVANAADGVGERIAAARTRKGIKQDDLASSLGVTQATVSRWERGAAFSNVTTLRRIADALNVTVCDLIEEAKAS